MTVPTISVSPIAAVFGGTNGSDYWQLSPSTSIYYALGGDDTVYGSDAPDVIDGETGNDNLTGNGGNDTLIGGLGLDN